MSDTRWFEVDAAVAAATRYFAGAVLIDQKVPTADATRRFRSVAAHAYDSFDHTQAVSAVAGAALLVDLLPSEIARFRQVVDP